MANALIGEKMELEYEKKDVAKSPKVKKVVKKKGKVGYTCVQKRGSWHVRGHGEHLVFPTEADAKKWLEII